jgi:two-component system response regulator NreC
MNHIRVFLVDDHHLFLDGLVRLLQDQPTFKPVGTASNGRDALQQIKTLRPDVVLMDISMPDLNGIEATRRVSQISPTTKVVLLSMYDSEEFLHRALEAGAKGYLLKDATAQELFLAIREAHRGHVYLSPCISRRLIPAYLQKVTTRRPAKPAGAGLSAREREVLQLVAEGKSTKTIAARLQISAPTVDTHRKNIMRKLDLHRIADLVCYAIRTGLIESPRPPRI